MLWGTKCKTIYTYVQCNALVFQAVIIDLENSACLWMSLSLIGCPRKISSKSISGPHSMAKSTDDLLWFTFDYSTLFLQILYY